jgi:hypothetical protein
MVRNDEGTHNEDHEGAIDMESELNPHRNERGISPERWAESVRADEDPGLLTRAGCHMQQPSGCDQEGPPEALEAMNRRVETQAEVGRIAEETGDPSPRRLE